MNHDFLNGLSEEQVEHSRSRHGSNTLSKQKRRGFWRQYLASFGDPIIKILLIALAVNVIFLFGDSGWYESAGIAVAVVLATLVSTLSEYGSESAFEKLQQESAVTGCRVRRAGVLLVLPVTELVVGDIVLLQAGERIPADGHIVSGELSVDQSALNGESREARKCPVGADLVSAQANRADTRYAPTDLLSPAGLFQGSVVCGGEGVMRVERIGDKTFYGSLAAGVQEETIDSPLKTRLQKLAKTISRLGYTAAVTVAGANLFNAFVIDSRFNSTVILSRLRDLNFVTGTLINTVTLAITVIVMAAPEGLPMMITVVLSANMKRMLKDNVLVRKLVGIETAGSLNILFTDKTGTLTKGKLLVTSFLCGSGGFFDRGELQKKAPSCFLSLIKGCVYNTDSAPGGGRNKAIGGNNTDRALLEYALPYTGQINGVTLESHTPFDSAKKLSISRIKEYGRSKYLIKGAPEIILEKCVAYVDESGEKKPFFASKLRHKINELGNRAIRMLALAESDKPIEPGQIPGLTLVGIICIRDELRKEARSAVAQITGAGIQTVMITGDNKQTAVAIARDAGLLSNAEFRMQNSRFASGGDAIRRPSDAESSIITSDELAQMSDREISGVLKHIRVVARALPTDKSRLVRIAQEAGLVAGMTGDGINDAPALKKADVGFSMGAGTEVAKEAGDIVIIDNNISSISKAILYGRAIFKSIRKFIIFQLTMNFCAVGLSVICPFMGIDAPLTVMQMLWVNMIMDTLAGLAFSGEIPLREYMREPPKKRDEAIINRYMYSQILFTGVYTTVLCLLFLRLPLAREFFRFDAGGDYFMTAFFALFIFAGVFNSLNARTYRVNLLSNILKNRMFLAVMLLICVIQTVLIYSGGAVFRTTFISAVHLQTILLLAATVIPADIVRKLWLRSIGRKGHI